MQERKYVDCREHEGSNCSLKISGSEEEVMRAATEHAVSVHGYKNDPQLKEELRKMLKSDTEESSTQKRSVA